jgi:hypothetical protein
MMSGNGRMAQSECPLRFMGSATSRIAFGQTGPLTNGSMTLMKVENGHWMGHRYYTDRRQD